MAFQKVEYSSRKEDALAYITAKNLNDIQDELIRLSSEGVPGGSGKDGKSAYELWLENGNEGTVDDFLLSLKGKDGEKGEQGEKGVYVGEVLAAPLTADVIFDNSDIDVITEGIAPDIQIGEVITVEPNEKAEVIRKGTNKKPIFDFKIPRGFDGASKLTRLLIEDSTLQLTTDKWQTVVMENNTTIALPQVGDFTEIHLFFRTNSELTLILPSAVWKNQPTIEANKVYEFVFTYVDEWIAGCIVYNE